MDIAAVGVSDISVLLRVITQENPINVHPESIQPS